VTVQNRCSNFDNTQILIFCALSLKMPIHTPKMGVMGDLTPKMGTSIERNPQKAFPCMETRLIDRQNQSTGAG